MKKKVPLSELGKLQENPAYLEAVRGLRAMKFDYEGLLGFAAALLGGLATTEAEVRKWLGTGPAEKSKQAAEKYAWLDPLIAKVFATPSQQKWSWKEIGRYVELELEVNPALNFTGLTTDQITGRIKRQAAQHRRRLGIARKQKTGKKRR